MSATKTAAATETVAFECRCGRVHVVNEVEHYGRYILGCGVRVWALRPLRNGPLKLFLWPGPAMSSRELAQKEADEREDGYNAARLSA